VSTHLLDHAMIVPDRLRPSATVLARVRFGAAAARSRLGCTGQSSCEGGSGGRFGVRFGIEEDFDGLGGAFGLSWDEVESTAARIRDDVAATWHAAEDAVQALVWTPIDRISPRLVQLQTRLLALASEAHRLNLPAEVGNGILVLADRVGAAIRKVGQGAAAAAEALWKAGPADELIDWGFVLLLALIAAGVYVVATPGGQALLRSVGATAEGVGPTTVAISREVGPGIAGVTRASADVVRALVPVSALISL